ncbi:MAG: cyclic nucleotide-binding domain-containing protein [Acidobacteriia bacterium]|nr:cyclic nucleotide-binding domain-containing protein [Terriglobia bacterium]
MSLLEDLRKISTFAGLPEDHLAWLAEQGHEVRLAPGEVLTRVGDPADRMFVILEGEMQFRRDSSFVSTARAGAVSGLLPFSRMTHFPVTGEAVTAARVAWFSSSIFPEMCQRMPPLIGRLVALLTDRVREVTRMDEQREKLASLGKLSAGLAHELNNPAAAARRAAAGLGNLLTAARENNLRLNQFALTSQQREYIARFERDTGHRAFEAPVSIAALEQSDREEKLGAWLEAHQVHDGWKIAPVFVEAGIDNREMDSLVEHIGLEPLGEVLGRVAALLTAAALVREIEHSTARISDLVKAIKEYSYMDQAPEQEVDLHSGLDNTLTIMGHKIKRGSVVVRREYDRSLPRICAWGSELNQVWTNLIDNAVDAMNANGAGSAKQLTVRTARDPMGVLVEIADTGPGIPKEMQGRIYDPFFTTKPVGEGTGLGLDAVSRIVRKHRGDIRLDSKPGDTRFQVRLPLSRPHQ